VKLPQISRTGVALAVLVAAGAGLRFATLGHQSYGHDESATLVVLHHSFGGTWNAIVAEERSPPLYYLIAWPWVKLFGSGEVGLRSLSAVFGTLSIPAAFLCARRLARAGLLAAALVAFNPFLIWYSQEARSYALLVCLTAWALYWFLLALGDRRRRSLTLWAIASALALLAHYFAVFLFVPQALVLLLTRRPRRPVVVAVASVAAVGAAVAPLAIAQSGNGGGQLIFIQTDPAAAAVEPGIDLAGSAQPHLLDGPLGVQVLRGGAAVLTAVVVLVGVLLLIDRARRNHDRRGPVVLGVTVAAFALPFAGIPLGADYVDPRNLIACDLPLLVLVAVGLAAGQLRRIGAIAALAWIGTFGVILAAVWVNPQFQRKDWRAAAAAVDAGGAPAVVVVTRPGYLPFLHYLPGRPFYPGHDPCGVTVSQIEVVSDSNPPPPSPPGFHPAGPPRAEGTLFVRRYVANHPVDVRWSLVGRQRFLGEASDVFIVGSPPTGAPPSGAKGCAPLPGWVKPPEQSGLSAAVNPLYALQLSGTSRRHSSV